MTPPSITVLITTYNYGRFIEEAIDSVLSQDFPSNQIGILVVDDGSTDDTSERVKKYGPRIEYFYKPNGGQASALNFGFAKARGEIVALLDADDLFLPGKLARVAAAFQHDPALGMVYHRLLEWHMRTDQRLDHHFVSVSGDLRAAPEQMFLFAPQPTSAISFRRSSLRSLVPIPEHIRMMADCYPVALIPFLAPILAIPECLTVYRIHGKNSLPYFANAYLADESQMPIETRKARLHLWQIVIDAMRKWLTDNGFTRKQPAVRAFLDCWSLLFQQQQFLIDSPTGVRFFLFLLRQNYAYRSFQTWRFTLFNYLCAPLALGLGYKKTQLAYGFRLRAIETVQRWLGMVLRKRSTRYSEGGR